MKTSGDFTGYVGIDVGGSNAGMAEQILDDPDIFAVLQKMSGKGMAQGMGSGGFVDAALADRLSEGDFHRVSLLIWSSSWWE